MGSLAEREPICYDINGDDMQTAKRKRNRFPGYDYSQNGTYFITVCTKNKRCILSKIVGVGDLDDPEIRLTEYGIIAQDCIKEINDTYEDLEIEKYVVMPNHIHFLVNVINGSSRTPTHTSATIPKLVSTFKRFCNKKYGEDIWQRSYYDHIIRDENDYFKIWDYINSNPAKWLEDKYYTK